MMNIVIPDELKPLVKAVRADNLYERLGNATLQGRSRTEFVIGDPDPFRPGHTIQPSPSDPSRPDLAIDRIVAAAKVVLMPGFLALPSEQMFMVVNAPLNLQYMSRIASIAKGSGDVADMTNVDPAWQEEQRVLQQQIEQQLQDVIDQLVACLPPGQ